MSTEEARITHVINEDKYPIRIELTKGARGDLLNSGLQERYGQQSDSQTRKPTWTDIPTKESQFEENVVP